jgi:phage terminase large subunit
MDKNKALKILKEGRRRQEEQSILKDCFPEQLRFITDKSKKKAALCSRRASKSYSAAIMLIQACLENPNIANAYLGLTKETAKNVLIPHIKKLKRKYKLNCTIYKSPTSVTFPNGSSILFFGLNDSAEEKDKILGQAFKVVVIDECASMTIDLRATIQEFISPTLLDHEGQLVLIGTPQNLRNYFYDITTNKIPGWSVHRWTADKNPFVAKQYNNEIDEL